MPDSPFSLSEEQILSLPLDDVALAVPRDIDANPTSMSNNWVGLVTAGQARNGPRYSKPAVDVLCEAWEWLRNKGLVAEDITSTNRHAILVTRLGHLAASQGAANVHAQARLSLDLHQILEERVRGLFIPGKFDTAAFEAFKAVEIRVRKLAALPETMLGVKLMRSAFGEGGALRNTEADPGERVARMELFAGAIGLFKNPTSHREVVFDDPTEASEVILLADLLMRILDRIENEELIGS